MEYYISPTLHALLSSELTAATFYLKETLYGEFQTEHTGVKVQEDMKVLSKVFFENWNNLIGGLRDEPIEWAD